MKKNNEVNYENNSNAKSSMFSDYDQYSPTKVPKQTNFKNPVNYTNESNTIEKENIRNVNDILVNYGIRIENKHELIKEGITVKDKPTLTDDLIVVTRKGISFTLDELDVRIRSLILDTTVPKREIAALIVSEVSKYIPQDTSNILDTLIEVKNNYQIVSNDILSINNKIENNTISIVEINELLVIENNTLTNIQNEINSIKLDITSSESRIDNLILLGSTHTSEINEINLKIIDLQSKISVLEVGETDAKNRISLIESTISAINLEIVDINSSLTSINLLIDSNSSKITNLTNIVGSNSDDIENINLLLVDINNELTTIRAELSENGQSLSTISNLVSQHTLSINDLIQNISSLHGEVNSIKINSDKVSGILSSVGEISAQLSNTIYLLDQLTIRVSAIDPNDNTTNTRITSLETEVTNLNNDVNNISTLVSDILLDEEGEHSILTNNIKILNYKYYEMYEMNNITYVVKKNKTNKTVIKRVEESSNSFDIRYSQPFNLDELPTKLSNLEGVGYIDLDLINI